MRFQISAPNSKIQVLFFDFFRVIWTVITNFPTRVRQHTKEMKLEVPEDQKNMMLSKGSRY